MPAVISEIQKNSIAQELDFEKGDKIISINGEKPQDMIDYRYMMCAEDIELEIEKNNGDIEIYEIEKDYDEDLGVVFESAVPPEIGSDVFGTTWNASDFRVYVPAEGLEAYEAVDAEYWQQNLVGNGKLQGV